MQYILLMPYHYLHLPTPAAHMHHIIWHGCDDLQFNNTFIPETAYLFKKPTTQMFMTPIYKIHVFFYYIFQFHKNVLHVYFKAIQFTFFLNHKTVSQIKTCFYFYLGISIYY